MQNFEEKILELCDRCVDTYTPDDILKHYMEETMEANLAVYRVTRDREALPNLIEELVDNSIECLAMLTLLRSKGWELDINLMFEHKLKKFETMLDRDKRAPGEPLKQRYRSIENYI